MTRLRKRRMKKWSDNMNTKEQKHLLFVILTFLFMAAVIAIWFKGWYYIYQTDSLFYLNPRKRVYDSLYFWKDTYSLGYSSPGFNLVPFYFTQYTLYLMINNLLKNMWKSLVLSEALMYYVIIFLSMFSSFLFFQELYKMLFKHNSNSLKTIEVVGLTVLSLFYTINVHTVIIVYWRFLTWALFWPATPLLLYLYLKIIGAKNIREVVFYTILSSTLFLTPLGGGFSQAGFFLLFLVLLIISIFLYIIIRNSTIFKKFLIFVILIFILLSWVLIPQFFFIKATYSFAASTYSSGLEQLRYSSKFTTILNIMRFMGYYVFYSTYGNLSYPYIWSKTYEQDPQILTFLYPILLALVIFMLYREENHKIKQGFILLLVIELILVFVMKGVAKPIPQFGYVLFKLNNVFFRHPYDRFIHMYFLLYCILLLYIIRVIVLKINYKFSLLIFLIILSVNFIASYPFFTGEIIHPLDKVYLNNTDYLQYLPSVLRSLCKNINCGNYRVLVVPFSVYGEFSYNISHHVCHVILKPLIYNFLPINIKMIQMGYSPYEKQFFSYLNSLTKEGNYWEFVNILRLYGIKYIIMHRDYTLEYVTRPWFIGANKEFMFNLEKTLLIERVWKGKNLIIYKVKGNVKPIVHLIDRGYDYDVLKSILMNSNKSIIIGADDLAKENGYNKYLIEDPESPLGIALSLKPGINMKYTIRIPKDGVYNLILIGRGLINLTVDNYSRIINGSGTIHIYLKRGYHRLVLHAAPIISYEFHNNFNLSHLVLLNKQFHVYLQNNSLCITTNIRKQWSYLSLPPMKIKPGEYIIVIRMKYVNTYRTHVVMRIYNSLKNKWRYYTTIVPGLSGTSSWQILKKRISIFGNESVIVLLRINAGGVKDQTLGNATTCISYINIFYANNRIFAIVLRPLNSYRSALKENNYLYFRTVNPTLKIVGVDAKKPFLLVFAESYDPLWEADVYKNGILVEKVRSIPVYGVINGFWINQTGNLTIIIRYLPQRWFELGLKISVTAFVLSVLYFFWDWRRERRDRWALKLEHVIKSVPRYVRR